MFTPSIVGYQKKKFPNSVLVGKDAENSMFRNLKNTISGIKQIIGKKFSEIETIRGNDKWPFKIFEGEQDQVLIEVSDGLSKQK